MHILAKTPKNGGKVAQNYQKYDGHLGATIKSYYQLFDGLIWSKTVNNYIRVAQVT